jgi:hypothetical protein
MFDALVSRIPLSCDALITTDVTSLAYAQITRRCILAAGVWPRLPMIAMRISADMNAPPLHLNTSDLLLSGSQSSTTPFCLERTDSLYRSSPRSVLIFGTRPLRSLFTVLRFSNYSVGFANKIPASTYALNAAVQCATKLTCVGQQTVYTPYNMCLDPQCSDYYLFDFDASSHTCVLSTSFHVLLGIVIAVFVLAEMVLNEIALHVSKRVIHSVPSTV